VVIDTPPLVPQIDSAVIAKKVDSVVIVVSRDRTTKQQLRDAAAALGSGSSHVAGTVLNAAPAAKGKLAGFVTRQRIDSFAALGLLLPVRRETAEVEETAAAAPDDNAAARREGHKKVPVTKP
jgi:hypothetical protein